MDKCTRVAPGFSCCLFPKEKRGWRRFVPQQEHRGLRSPRGHQYQPQYEHQGGKGPHFSHLTTPCRMEEDEMYYHSEDELLGEGDTLSQGSLSTR